MLEPGSAVGMGGERGTRWKGLGQWEGIAGVSEAWEAGVDTTENKRPVKAARLKERHRL